MRTRISLEYFLNDCLCKPFFDTNSTQIPSNLNYLVILVSLRPLTLSQSKVRVTKLEKRAKI